MKRLNICDYWGCRDPIEPTENNIKDGMRFCKKHQSQVNALVDTMDVKGLLSFWVKAGGGAKKMASTPAGVYHSHELAEGEDD